MIKNKPFYILNLKIDFFFWLGGAVIKFQMTELTTILLVLFLNLFTWFEFVLILLTITGFVSPYPHDAGIVHVVVDSDVAVLIEVEAHFIAAKRTICRAHNDVLGAQSEIRARAVQRLHPDEFPAQNGNHVLIGLDNLYFVSRFLVDNFVAQNSATEN